MPTIILICIILILCLCLVVLICLYTRRKREERRDAEKQEQCIAVPDETTRKKKIPKPPPTPPSCPDAPCNTPNITRKKSRKKKKREKSSKAKNVRFASDQKDEKEEVSNVLPVGRTPYWSSNVEVTPLEFSEQNYRRNLITASLFAGSVHMGYSRDEKQEEVNWEEEGAKFTSWRELFEKKMQNSD